MKQAIKPFYDFAELHNSIHIIEERNKNRLIAKELDESRQRISEYANNFVSSFIFDSKTIDAYLSKSDIRLICKNDKILNKFYDKNLQMSQIISNLKESDWYNYIPRTFGRNDGDYKPEHAAYRNDRYFVDAVNKKIYFVPDNGSLSVNLNEDTIKVMARCNYDYCWYGQSAKSDRVYPHWQHETASVFFMELKISLINNCIVKDEA